MTLTPGVRSWWALVRSLQGLVLTGVREGQSRQREGNGMNSEAAEYKLAFTGWDQDPHLWQGPQSQAYK